MARAYTIATAALALNTSTKWLDNVLSHNTIPGVVQEKQGVARRITVDGLLILSLVLLLTSELGTTVGTGIEIARKMIATRGSFASAHGLSMTINLETLSDQLLVQLERAVEVAPLPRRGRPPKNKTGRLE